MELHQFIDWLWDKTSDFSGYSVVALILENRNDGNAYEEWPVTAICVDEQAETVDLIVTTEDKGKGDPETQFEVIELLLILSRLLSECHDYDMFLGSVPVDICDGYTSTQDFRVVGMAWSNQLKNLGFASFRTARAREV